MALGEGIKGNDMNRIKANQIANGYLSEGIDEGINPEYFLANEAQAEIDDYRNIIYKVRMLLPSYAKEAVDDVLNKHRRK